MEPLAVTRVVTLEGGTQEHEGLESLGLPEVSGLRVNVVDLTTERCLLRLSFCQTVEIGNVCGRLRRCLGYLSGSKRVA